MATLRNVNELKEWEGNLSVASQEEMDRLDEMMELGQIDTLLVMPDGTTLGGNKRLRRYKEKGVTEVEVKTVDFLQDEAGMWYGVVDGVPSNRKFSSREAGMYSYALAHNANIGHADKDKIANVYDTLEIDWNLFDLRLEDPTVGQDVIDMLMPKIDEPEDEKPNKYRVIIECETEQYRDEVYTKLAEIGISAKKK